MARVRSLEGREAGILAGTIQGTLRLFMSKPLNPIKVYAYVDFEGEFRILFQERIDNR
jgi:hypothetical protein